jgi:hypothetical protein
MEVILLLTCGTHNFFFGVSIFIFLQNSFIAPDIREPTQWRLCDVAVCGRVLDISMPFGTDEEPNEFIVCAFPLVFRK